MENDSRFSDWIDRLKRRHMNGLTFPELRRALQALSGLYLHRRDRMRADSGLDSAGKRAAFAIFYGPLHFLAVRGVAERLSFPPTAPSEILDLGCGTGAGSAAWALTMSRPPGIRAVDRSRWAVEEARWTFSCFGLKAAVHQEDLLAAPIRRSRSAVLAAYSVNELADGDRSVLLRRLLAAGARGSWVLVVEPIAHRLNPWLGRWEEAFTEAGGSCREWRLESELPAFLLELDHAAGFDHAREITCRSLCLGAAAGARPGEPSHEP